MDEKTTLSDMFHILQPISKCIELLNGVETKVTLTTIVEHCMNQLVKLEDDSLRGKQALSLSSLHSVLNLLASKVNVDYTKVRFKVTLRMLNVPHYDAKMNALRDINDLINDTLNGNNDEREEKRNELVKNISEKKVITTALNGSVDQLQYTERLSSIVNFLAKDLSDEDLQSIWKQIEKHCNAHVTANIFAIVKSVTGKLGLRQIEFMDKLIRETWSKVDDNMRERLVDLLGQIGAECRPSKNTIVILKVLWDVSRDLNMSRLLCERALKEQLSILDKLTVNRVSMRRSYIEACMDLVKDGQQLLHHIKHLEALARSSFRDASSSYYSKSRNLFLSDLNSDLEIIPNLVRSIKLFIDSKSLLLLKDDRYAREDVFKTHLSVIDYLLKEGELYLKLNQALELFQALVESPKSTEIEHTVFFDWMRKCISDMTDEDQQLFFEQKLLHMKPEGYYKAGFECLKSFLIAVNVCKGKVKRLTDDDNFVVSEEDVMSVVGVDHLWSVLTDVEEESVATLATDLLLDISYRNVVLRVRRESNDLHSVFIRRCFQWAEDAYNQLLKRQQLQTSSKKHVRKGNNHILLLRRMQRLLHLLLRYIFEVEHHGEWSSSRALMPHRNTYKGPNVVLKVAYEEKHVEIRVDMTLLCIEAKNSHANETIGRVRTKVASTLRRCETDLLLRVNGHELNHKQDNRLLRDYFDPETKITVVVVNPRVPSLSTIQLSSSSSLTLTSIGSSQPLNEEARLPGVILASIPNFFVFLRSLLNDKELISDRLKTTIYDLLQLLPTDPLVTGTISSVSNGRANKDKSNASPSASPRIALTSPFIFKVDDDIIKLLDPEIVGNSILMLYHLEALSAFLKPAVDKTQDYNVKCAVNQVFKSVEGVKLLLKVLGKVDSMVDDESNEPRKEFCTQVLTFVINLLSFILGCDGDDDGGKDEDDDGGEDEDNGLRLRLRVPSSRPSPAKRGNFDLMVNSKNSVSNINERNSNRPLMRLPKDDFHHLISTLVNISWASATGNISLIRTRSNKEKKKSNDVGDLSSKLHFGCCSPSNQVTPSSSALVSSCLRLIVYCLEQRKRNVNLFFDQPRIDEFILDTLLNCSANEVRWVVNKELFRLAKVRNPSRVLSLGDSPTSSSTTTTRSLESSSSLPSCKHRLILLLLNKPVPLWSFGTQGTLLAQSEAYFGLRASLLQDMRRWEQRQVLRDQDVVCMIEDEQAFLKHSKPRNPSETLLLTGHLRLLRALVTCEGVDKERVGRQLIGDLLHVFLFPASKDESEESDKAGEEDSSSNPSLSSPLMNPKCDSVASRVAAYNLLVDLCRNCSSNMSDVSSRLVRMHHLFDPGLSKNFDFVANVERRADCGYVGLKNAGSTCYMNAVLQQLWATPNIAHQVLATTPSGTKPGDDKGLLYQLQWVFGHLSMSQVRFFEPRAFWQTFKLFDRPVNVREQQDAFDFFTQLTDQVDEQLKGSNQSTIFAPQFTGLYSDQKTCSAGCSHTYEREQEFIALNLPVKSSNLLESLEQFVQGDVLENENAYYCEKCDVKRSAVKHMRIKRLPKTLVIQLKRFHYDWETQKALKFDDYFSFPTSLDMRPYTTSFEDNTQKENGRKRGKKKNDLEDTREGDNTTQFALVGVVVHSGQANAGHYYSYIKERRRDEYEENWGKWFKFNDTSVEEFDMNDHTLKEECFGGDFELNNAEEVPRVKRVRSWNAYMLVYEACDKTTAAASSSSTTKTTTITTMTNKKTTSRRLPRRHRPKSVSSASVAPRDRLSQLSDLMLRSEKEGVFVTPRMPIEIERGIREENLRFLESRDVFSKEYFDLVINLIKVNEVIAPSHVDKSNENTTSMVISSLKLATQFLLNTYLHLRDCDKAIITYLKAFMEKLINCNHTGCTWLTKFLAANHSHYLRPFLLECHIQERRCVLTDLILAVYKTKTKGLEEYCRDKDLKTITTEIVALVERDAADNYRNAKELFALLAQLANLNQFTCWLLLDVDALSVLGRFLLGSDPNCLSRRMPKRKWTTMQSRHFAEELHAAISSLILACDFDQEGSDEEAKRTLKMPSSAQERLFESNFMLAYLRETMLFLRESHSSVDTLVTKSHVKLAGISHKFSDVLIDEILLHFNEFNTGELRQLANLLVHLICLEDDRQTRRLELIVHGKSSSSSRALLPIVKYASSAVNDDEHQLRAYQSIKILVASSTRSTLAKEFLLKKPEKWEVAVNWLRSRLEEDESEDDNNTLTIDSNYDDHDQEKSNHVEVRELSLTPFISSQRSTLTTNEGGVRVFRRTTSAQVTLEEAKAILYMASNDEEDEDEDEVMTDVDT